MRIFTIPAEPSLGHQGLIDNRMKKISLLLLCTTVFAALASSQTIRISTSQTDLILKVGPNERLYQSYLGPRLLGDADIDKLPVYVRPGSDGSIAPRGWEAYPGSGAEDYFEPALAVRHNDGNLTTVLSFVSSNTQQIDANTTHTTIALKDKVYPVNVTLHYMAFANENVIKTWSVITHNQKKPVSLWRYASSMLYFESPRYFLTEYASDWAREGQMSTTELNFGKKTVESKLGSRAAMHASPFFELGLGQPASENSGNVLVGTLGWTGNFSFVFEVDNAANLRVISGINPYASDYELKPGETFTTPEFIFTYSENGTGQASRSLHAWARRYQLKDGLGDRLTLLNNWESTFFDFDQHKLAELMGEANHLGVDMFLLDDGWFGNKYPRANDKAGLGDWEATRAKLPDGIPFLVKKADEVGVKFGIWIEPEMVNPKSELFEKHPEWAIQLPNRQPYYHRNQLVLDLSNPKVQDYVFDVVDKLMTENPGIAFFKWDCNSTLTNPYSPYLKEKQSHLYIDHVRGLYQILKRVNAKYPNLPMMLCSGGGGRCDYEALKYFTEFWPSDNTDPVERLYIQWSFSKVFPSKAMCAHVTSWNKQASIKFRTDVAFMCKLGFDIGLKELSAPEQTFCREAVANYNRLKDVILNGDFYRLASPFEGNHAAAMHLNNFKTKAVVYAYQINPRYQEKTFRVKLQGLAPSTNYLVTEINLMPGNTSSLPQNGQVLSGDYLMKVGLDLLEANRLTSKIIELTAR